MRANERREALDVVRAVAAFAIVVHHVAFASGDTLNGSLGEFTGRLDVGVSIFFVLSGYLLFRPWIEAILAGGPLPAARAFLVRRAVRIFPAYWLALGVLLVIDAVQVGDLGGLLATASLTQIYQSDTALLGIVQAWSLATEIGFYLALPLIAIGLRRLVGCRTTNQRALVVLASLFGLAVSAYLFRSAMSVWGGGLSGIAAFWVPAHADTFAAGMAIATVEAWSRRSSDIAEAIGRWPRRRWPYLVGAAAVFMVASTQFELAVGLESASLNRELARHAAYTLIGALLVVPYALGRPVRGAHRVVAVSAWLGLVSYGIYLWHQVLIAGSFADRVMPWALFDGAFWPRLLATVPVAVVAGAASWYLVERPALRASSRLKRTP